MISLPLLKQLLRSNGKFLLAFTLVLCTFLTIMCNVFTPETLQGVEQSASNSVLGQLLGNDGTLIGFMANFFYAVMAIIFPMLYCILVGNRLIAEKVDRGDMACLLSTPTTRLTITVTSAFYFVVSLIFMWCIASVVGIMAANAFQPDALDVEAFLWINAGCFLYHFVISSLCFFFSCVCNLTKSSLTFGAGIPLFFFVVNLLLKVSKDLDFLKYFTLNTLFDTNAIVEGSGFGMNFVIMLVMGAFLYTAAIVIFDKKDLPL